MSGNSAAHYRRVFVLCLALLAWTGGLGWSGAVAQGQGDAGTQGEAVRAQRELTAAESVLHDARESRAKIESALGEQLARIEERRRNASAISDETQRRNALRALDAEEKQARDDIAKARAAETIAERNAEIAALALARARAGGKDSVKGPLKPIVGPTAKPAVAPALPAKPPATAAKPAAPPATPPPQATPAVPSTDLDALILTRMDVESAEAAFARARAAREEAERASGDETRELARLLADVVELKKHAEGSRRTEAVELEANLKARIAAATEKLSETKAREAQAKAALDTARAREAKARAEIEARIKKLEN